MLFIFLTLILFKKTSKNIPSHPGQTDEFELAEFVEKFTLMQWLDICMTNHSQLLLTL